MAEYSKIAIGKVTSTGAATPVILPFQPDIIKISNATRSGSAGVISAWWTSTMGQAAAFLTTTSTGSPNTDTTTFVSSNGFSTFSAGQLLQYGAAKNVASITKASAGVVTSTAHGLVSGDVVVFQNLYESASTGMQQIAGIPFVVTRTGADTFTIPFNTNQSNFTAIDGGATVQGTFRQVLYPSLYVPGASFITALTLSTSTTVSTSMAHNMQVGQEVAFRIPSSYGTTQLNSLPDVIIPGQPIYGYVSSVTNSTTLVVNIDSSAYTAFNNNQAFTSFPGLNFPMLVAVGDNNSGSLLSGYSAPSVYLGTSTAATSLLIGPAIAGAYINASYQGFVIGSSVAGTASDVLYYEAIKSDLSL